MSHSLAGGGSGSPRQLPPPYGNLTGYLGRGRRRLPPIRLRRYLGQDFIDPTIINAFSDINIPDMGGFVGFDPGIGLTDLTSGETFATFDGGLPSTFNAFSDIGINPSLATFSSLDGSVVAAAVQAGGGINWGSILSGAATGAAAFAKILSGARGNTITDAQGRVWTYNPATGQMTQTGGALSSGLSGLLSSPILLIGGAVLIFLTLRKR